MELLLQDGEKVKDNNESLKQEFIVDGGEGKAFQVKKDQTVTVTDIEGQQVIDFIAFSANNYKEFLSVTQTRTNLKQQFYLGKNDVLLTNLRNPMANIIEDTVEVHDLLIAACDPYYYEEVGMPGHRSCHQNFVDVLEPYGIEAWQRPDPFNIFQNTQIRSDGTWFQNDPPSKAGDYITLQFEMDALCAISVCPFDIDGFNGGAPTPVKVKVD
ncbi:DUF1989 domain-containing protein [Virgibacillus sp. W0181]|uniref:DUF1989 domain-containing protein n=1 Tax=Virgibacillus sp. W0181 TaxID=3391581 RepID=UPI003F4520AE